MENLIKNGSKGVMVKLYSMEVKQEDENIPKELIYTLEKHYRFFQEIPKGLPPYRYHEHKIKLILRYPHQQKGEIEKTVQDMLDSSTIKQSRSSFSDPIVIVRRKDNSWRMCLDYRDLNKITIKDKFHISKY
jgi:hypothetical protein